MSLPSSCGRMKYLISSIIVIFSLFTLNAAASSDEKDCAEKSIFITASRQKQLAFARQWIRLGHWRQGSSGQWESEVDGAAFFLSPEGKTDPDAELEATLKGIFAPAGQDEDVHVMCRFPARTAYLVRQLGIDPNCMPRPSCPGFDQFWASVRAQSATLIFSSYYLNNPASAFGHTFLRINKSYDDIDSTKRRELLDYGIEFSAEVDTYNSVIYAFKGLTGLFPGKFRQLPYYYKVREYNDYESRDLWEYDLDLRPEQVAMLVAHLWEMGSTHFDYWYLTENCSYHILGVLEAANPNLELLDHVGFPAIPADTVKALFMNPGLVRDIRYRPSILEQLKARIRGMPLEHQRLVTKLAEKPDAPFPDGMTIEERIRVLDSALDLVDFRWAKELIHERDCEGAKIKQRLMERRAQIRHPSPKIPTDSADRKRIEHGHGSMRQGFGGGLSDHQGAFAEYDIRLALHDLVDPVTGYPEFSQIEFLPVRARFYTRTETPSLEEAFLVRIVSLTPMNRFDKQISWKFKAGAKTLRDDGCDNCLAGMAEVGGGAAWALPGGELGIFATGDTALFASPRLSFNSNENIDYPVRAGLGPGGGLRWRPRNNLIALMKSQWLWLPVQDPQFMWEADATLRWGFYPNIALDAQGRLQDKNAEFILAIYCYY